MNIEQYLKNLTPPDIPVDIVLDTDAYTEVDDLYAISYAVKNSNKLNVKGITIAPFYKLCKASSIIEGIHKSYDEVLKILELTNRQDLCESVFKGSEAFLENEETPVESDAVDFLSKICDNYSPEKPLYVVAIGALTNVASAILKNASFKENCVVVWLGGNALHMPNGANEYNLVNDIAAARVVFGCGIPFVQVPCIGVADRFLTTEFELKHWLGNKNALCDYLIENTVGFSEMYSKGKPWSRVIWDVTAVAWLLNGDKKFMLDKLIKSPIPEYNKQYAIDEQRHEIKCVYQINRDKLFEDLFNVLGR